MKEISGVMDIFYQLSSSSFNDSCPRLKMLPLIIFDVELYTL